MLVAGCLTVAQGIGNSGSFWPRAFASNFGRFSSLAGISTLAADALGRDRRLSESTILLWVLRSTELHWQSGPSGMSHCHCHRDPSGPGDRDILFCTLSTVQAAFARGARSLSARPGPVIQPIQAGIPAEG